jgi:extradiol dioxygenase family protein
MTVARVVPILTVEDIEATRDAYVVALGLAEVMNHGWIVTLADAEHRHQLSLMTKDQTAPVNEERGVRRFFFADGSGNIVNVLSHR